eukprot:CAMPEP_0197611256 /NCGR_PEP_ID=MMETSP1326-20131121/55015_1 /TAXON_ID=1155430 /ORGANISM="Genus nov. species nov., Strain RCC2288" /LENGTH=287 /DNA_ID=CAMNT_0043179885 /DNA_START=45 /DNA_END=905 /DNA_ORIENTATION=+
MAKKGRVARILNILCKVNKQPQSEALKRRDRSAKSRGGAPGLIGTAGSGGGGSKKSEWKKRKERQARKASYVASSTETGLAHGYHSGMKILLVGEGNLSFALALVTLFDGDGANVLATSFDRHGVARAAYPDCRDIEESLEAAGAGIRFGVDAEDYKGLSKTAKEWWGGAGGPHGGGTQFAGFDRVVFNFPDRGVGTVGLLPVRANQEMLANFFKAAKGLLSRTGEVHVAMGGDEAHKAWNLVGLAAKGGLTYRAALEFKPEDFPGYVHFRTLPHMSLLTRRRGGRR